MIFPQDLQYALIAILTVIGFMLGSFVSVLSSRDLKKQWKSILIGRSRCPHCGKNLTWKELIPLISWIVQKGKCRSCQKAIGVKYPLLEIITALLLIGLFLTFGQTWMFVAQALLLIILLSMVIEDLETMMVSDSLLIICLIPLIWISWLEPDLFNRVLGLSIFTVLISLFVIPSKGKWMGFADLKIAPILGWLLAFPNVIIGIYGAFISGGLLSVILLAVKKVKSKSPVPFFPFLIFGYYIAVFFGKYLINSYLMLI